MLLNAALGLVNDRVFMLLFYRQMLQYVNLNGVCPKPSMTRSPKVLSQEHILYSRCGQHLEHGYTTAWFPALENTSVIKIPMAYVIHYPTQSFLLE